MRTLEATRFQDADKYSSYLKTPGGRLRGELAWENLRRFLPPNARERRVLDLGGGTGFMSVRLAKMGFQVVLLDGSEAMLEIARKEAKASGTAEGISFHHADANQLHELLEPQSSDVVLCHNLLEYLADPPTIVSKIAHVLRRGGVVSTLVRNRAGEVLKAAIRSDWELAKANLSAETVVDSLYGKPVRVFGPKDVTEMLRGAGLHVEAQYGVRVFSDYVDQNGLTSEASYGQLLELELLLGTQPNFATIARYTQVIARHSTPIG